MQPQQSTGTLETTRSTLRVSYLSSTSYSTTLVVLHFFQVAEQTQNSNNNRPSQKRLLLLVDPPTYKSDIDTAITRCVMISKIEEMVIQREHLTSLTTPFCAYDVLLQHYSLLDFIRMIGAIYRPTHPPSLNIPLFELEENQPVAGRVLVRLMSNVKWMKEEMTPSLSDVAMKTLQDSSAREVASLKEALQRQRDTQVLELLELHTQNESLKHSLSQTEQYTMAVKRSHKEEREQLMGRIGELEQYIRRCQSSGGGGAHNSVTPTRSSAPLIEKMERDLQFGNEYMARLQGAPHPQTQYPVMPPPPSVIGVRSPQSPPRRNESSNWPLWK